MIISQLSQSGSANNSLSGLGNFQRKQFLLLLVNHHGCFEWRLLLLRHHFPYAHRPGIQTGR